MGEPVTRYLLDEVLDAKPAPAPPARPAIPAAVEGWRAIPQGCSPCVWVPDFSTVPATWRLPERNTRPGCKLHGGNGTAA
jgi:hypothetical protein